MDKSENENVHKNDEKRIHKRSVNTNHDVADVSYIFPAYGREFLLDLTFTKDFISPALIIQRYDKNNSWIEEGTSEGLEQCFYSGKVNKDTHSRAVFNLCDGMVSKFYKFYHFAKTLACNLPIGLPAYIACSRENHTAAAVT